MPFSFIQTALAHLEKANYAGYFEAMDQVEMPKPLRSTYAQLKGVFLAGQPPWDYAQKLETLAREAGRLLAPDEGSTPVPVPPDIFPKNLSGRQKEAFCKALIAAYLSLEDLAQFTLFKLDIPLNTITGERNLKNAVFDLVQYAEAQGRLAQMLAEVYEDKGQNLQIQAFVEGLRD
ncbi:MAG: hypothetical protein HC913_15540 [Microscillaceae bacterium]|nr:hypothetical protein [Microscillaceae bacterium]